MTYFVVFSVHSIYYG